MMENSTLVMKFGGASVATPKHFSEIAKIIVSKRKTFTKVIVVVSAMGNTTDQLAKLAKQVNPNPPRREYDMLVTAGERISISLLAMALAKKNLEAVSFTGSQSGIITCAEHTDARIKDVRPHRLLKCLDQGKVVIVAGFQGVSQCGEITTLGRGGSDTTAVALGVAMKATRIEFFKDVEGIYCKDPKKYSDAKILPEITYDEALEIVKKGAIVLRDRCIKLAQVNKIPLHVRSFKSDSKGTVIYDRNKQGPISPIYEE